MRDMKRGQVVNWKQRKGEKRYLQGKAKLSKDNVECGGGGVGVGV